jgi:hypothetical protein
LGFQFGFSSLGELTLLRWGGPIGLRFLSGFILFSTILVLVLFIVFLIIFVEVV